MLQTLTAISVDFAYDEDWVRIYKKPSAFIEGPVTHRQQVCVCVLPESETFFFKARNLRFSVNYDYTLQKIEL